MIAQLNTKLKNIEENLKVANKCEKYNVIINVQLIHFLLQW